MNPRNYTDILAGAAVALFAVTGLAYLIPVGVKSPPNVKVPALAPEFWPTIILWLMLAFAVVILVQGVVAVMRTGTNEAPEQNALAEEDTVNGSHGDASSSARMLRTIAAIGLLFAYQALIDVIGMLAVSILACLAFTILSGERRYKIFVPVAVLLPTILYYFFTKVAGVPLPLGIFEELNL
jgi:hypothetical protein